MQQLDRLDVRSRKMLRGTMQGERRSKKRGQSVEFADYRPYVVGDDLRRIDWNLYARLDKLFLRLFMEEEDLSVTVAVDASASMRYGDPEKLLYARRLAAALGYLALVHHNRVNLYRFGTGPLQLLEDLRGRRPIPRMLRFLDDEPAGSTGEDPAGGSLEQSMRDLAIRQRRSGVVIVISDLLDKGDLADSLRYLADPRYDAYVLQVLSPVEVDPSQGSGAVTGDLRLVDLEDGDQTEVSVTPALIKRYKATVQAYCRHAREACHRRGLVYLLATTDVPVETVVLRYLRQRGLVG
jgi:uncharacterized protein (DUF58 family)